ncbi:MAG: response regulator [Bacilli bacterium]|nr:response regulator [Bacilli bacterium]
MPNTIVAWIELVCVVFTVIMLIGQYVDNERTVTLRWVKIFLFFTIFWLICDALALLLENKNTPIWILWVLNFLSFTMHPLCIVILALFADKFISEKGKCSKWWFRVPQIIFSTISLGVAIYFIIGSVGSVNNGDFVYKERLPRISLYFYILFIVYSSIVAFILRKRIGLKAVIITGISFVPIIGSIFALYFTDADYTAVSVSIFAAMVCGALQRENIRSRARGNVIAENNDRILALNDNFELLYDVDIETGHYDTFVKGQTFSQTLNDRLVNSKNFFEDSLTNAEKVCFSEDVLGFKKIMNPSFVREELDKNDHYDYTYRIVVDGKPIWMRMRFVYKNKDKKHIIVGAFNAEEMMKRKVEEEKMRNSLIESVLGNDAAFIVDLDEDTRTTILNNTSRKDEFSDKEKYSLGFSKYISKYVTKLDSKRVREMTSIPYIREKIKEVPEYSIVYRHKEENIQRFYEIRIVKLTDSEVIMGFTEKDVEILTNSIVDYLKNDYFAMYAIDVDEGFIHIIKDDPGVLNIKKGDVIEYKDFLLGIAQRFEEKSDEREYFTMMSDVDFLRRKFANQDKSSFIFHLTDSTTEKWATTKEIVLSRKATGNSPALIAICFSFLDKEAKDNAILQQKLEEDMSIIGGLAEEYQILFFVNIDEGILKVASVEKEYEPIVNDFLNSNERGLDFLKIFGQSPYVHPDDRMLFNEFGTEYILEKLKNTKKFVIRFRSRVGDTYSWFEMHILKNENIDERANHVIIGFTECAAEIEKEQLLQKSFDLLNKDISSDQAIKQLLGIVADYYGARRSCVCEILKHKDFINIAYEWDTDEVTEESLQHLEIPTKKLAPWLQRLTNGQVLVIGEEHDNDKIMPIAGIFKKNGFKQVILAPIINGGELVGFVGLDVPNKIITDFDSVRTVATIIYSELLKRKETDEEHVTLEKVTSSFATVYFVDLDRDYAHNWKLDKDYKYTDEDAAVSKFSESLSAYITFCVDPAEKERCYKQTSPEYILEQFKTKNIFSVNMKDVSRGNPTFLAFDFIKVTEDGKQFVVCSRDITDVLAKENEQKQKLQEALELADSANKAKTSFLFNMSHDIRTPMNAILGFTNMAMKNTKDEAKLIDCLRKTQQSGNMLVSLINNVLEVSRIESGHAKVEEKPVDAFKSFRSIDDTMMELAKSKNIDLKFEFGKYENRYAYCDVIRCSRIFVNIISNAIKYTPNGGKVVMKAEQVTFGNDVCIYRSTISDNGIGMSEEFQKHIFEQFTRESNTTLSGVEGTGLGMTVVKSFVDLLGGKISFTSKKDVGTTFVVELPFKIQQPPYKYYDPESGQIVDVDASLEEDEIKTDFSGKKVLLVEDNMLNAEITTEILQDEGFVVEHANDGTVAVEFLKNKGPSYYDIVLMDIQMPRMNGYDATKEIRKMYPDSNIPIIALSANAFQEDKDQSIAAGMNDHIAKPIDIKQLLIIVGKYVK